MHALFFHNAKNTIIHFLMIPPKCHPDHGTKRLSNPLLSALPAISLASSSDTCIVYPHSRGLSIFFHGRAASLCVVFFQAKILFMQLSGQCSADIAVMLWFIDVSGQFFLALRIAHDPAITPAVFRHPFAQRRVLQVVMQLSIIANVYGQSQLMLARSRISAV